MIVFFQVHQVQVFYAISEHVKGCCWPIIAGDSKQRGIYADECQGIELGFFVKYISHILMLSGAPQECMIKMKNNNNEKRLLDPINNSKHIRSKIASIVRDSLFAFRIFAVLVLVLSDVATVAHRRLFPRLHCNSQVYCWQFSSHTAAFFPGAPLLLFKSLDFKRNRETSYFQTTALKVAVIAWPRRRFWRLPWRESSPLQSAG